MPVALTILQRIGITACLIIGIIVFYEGIPGLNRFPIIGAVPIVGDIVAGRVAIVRDQAVKDATAEMVSRVEMKVAQARAAELERQMKRNSEAALAAHKQAEIALANAEAARTELERRIADEKDKRAARWGTFDFERMQQHRKPRAP